MILLVIRLKKKHTHTQEGKKVMGAYKRILDIQDKQEKLIKFIELKKLKN